MGNVLLSDVTFDELMGHLQPESGVSYSVRLEKRLITGMGEVEVATVTRHGPPGVPLDSQDDVCPCQEERDDCCI